MKIKEGKLAEKDQKILELEKKKELEKKQN